MPWVHRRNRTKETMTDLETFCRLAKKAGASFEEVSRAVYIGAYEGLEWTPSPRATVVVRVNPGYRCHFEADFDAEGNILSLGQWETL